MENNGRSKNGKSSLGSSPDEVLFSIRSRSFGLKVEKYFMLCKSDWSLAKYLEMITEFY